MYLPKVRSNYIFLDYYYGFYWPTPKEKTDAARREAYWYLAYNGVVRMYRSKIFRREILCVPARIGILVGG